MQGKTNIAERAAHWSATHRKTAIWGWLGIRVHAVALIMGAQVVEQKDISAVDSFSGESQQAERALTDAGLRPNEEVVLIQSERVAATDPEFQAVVAAAPRPSSRRPSTSPTSPPRSPTAAARSPRTGTRCWSTSRSPARTSTPATTWSRARTRSTALQAENPEYNVEQFGSASSDKEPERHVRERTSARRGCCPCPLTLIILAVALGGLVAAGVPLLLALTGVLATMALVAIPSQLFPLDGNVGALILLIGLAVGRRLLALLHAPRARGAGEGHEPAGLAAGGRADLGPRGDDLRHHGDDRHVRACSSPARRRSSRSRWPRSRRGGRDVRLAAGPAGGAGVARRPRREGPLPLTEEHAAPDGRVAVVERDRQRASCAGRCSRPSWPAAAADRAGDSGVSA